MQPALISYRDSKASPTEELPLRTWVKLAEVMARQVVCPHPFDDLQFARALTVCRKLTRSSGPQALKRMIAVCAAAGVAVVLVPNFSGCRLHSASKWLVPGRRALIALSIRYRRDDQIYFSLFREAGAILVACQDKSHTERAEAAEKIQKDGDASANSASSVLKPVFCPDEFARVFLIPPEYDGEVAAIGGIAGATEMSAAIEKLARRLRIAPGLVVGRLQHDELIPYSYQNRLKREVDLSYVLEASAAAEETWPDQNQATQQVMRDLSLPANLARQRLWRAAEAGRLLTNGGWRLRKRFEPGQLAAWRIKERNRDLDAEDRGKPDEREARKMREGMRGVMRGREDAA